MDQGASPGVVRHLKTVPRSRRSAPRSKSNAELSDDFDELKAEVKELRIAVLGRPGEEESGLCGMVRRLQSRFTLFFGLGIGAMASSGLISEAAAGIIKAVVGIG